MQQFSIHGRALLDVTDEGILIRPVENENAEAPELVAQEEAAARRIQQSGAIGGFFSRFRRKSRNDSE